MGPLGPGPMGAQRKASQRRPQRRAQRKRNKQWITIKKTNKKQWKTMHNHGKTLKKHEQTLKNIKKRDESKNYFPPIPPTRISYLRIPDHFLVSFLYFPFFFQFSVSWPNHGRGVPKASGGRCRDRAANPFHWWSPDSHGNINISLFVPGRGGWLGGGGEGSP